MAPRRSRCDSNEDAEDSPGPHAASPWGGAQPWLRISNLSPPRRRNTAPPRKNEFLAAGDGPRGNRSKKPRSLYARYCASHSTSVSSISPAPPEMMVEELHGDADSPSSSR